MWHFKMVIFLADWFDLFEIIFDILSTYYRPLAGNVFMD